MGILSHSLFIFGFIFLNALINKIFINKIFNFVYFLALIDKIKSRSVNSKCIFAKFIYFLNTLVAY